MIDMKYQIQKKQSSFQIFLRLVDNQMNQWTLIILKTIMNTKIPKQRSKLIAKYNSKKIILLMTTHILMIWIKQKIKMHILKINSK